MKITFIPELPSDDESQEMRENISREISHFEDAYQEFPSELVVQLETVSPARDRALELQGYGIRPKGNADRRDQLQPLGAAQSDVYIRWPLKAH